MAHKNVKIGVLALQGAFREHINIYEREFDTPAITVKTPEELAQVDALVIPGGESTTMALIAERTGMMEPLREWVKDQKPVWGTCAGLIFLANDALHTKKGGQQLLGGLDVVADRNHFGTQKDSFETYITAEEALGPEPFHAVFIRAPAVVKAGNKVQVLAKLKREDRDEEAIVAVRQGPFMATAFHPELTQDYRWHKYYLNMVNEHLATKA